MSLAMKYMGNGLAFITTWAHRDEATSSLKILTFESKAIYQL